MVEKQRFLNNPVIWLVLLIPIVIVFTSVNSNEINTDNLFRDFGGHLITLVLVLFLAVAPCLETEYNMEGITYRFFPFILKKKRILWADVQKAYVRKYNPLFEYGGWGIRGMIGGNNRAFNASGNIGLQLELKNGKKILFGTRKRDELEMIIQQYFKSTTSHK